MARRTDIKGMKELEKMMRELGKVPQKSVTKAAKAGGKVMLKAAKANAPEDLGNLKKGLKLFKEKRTKLGKAVYDVSPDPAMNDIFVKVSKAGKRSYYPASQEFGWTTQNGKYIPGYRYLKKSIDDNKSKIEDEVLETLGKDIEKALKG